MAHKSSYKIKYHILQVKCLLKILFAQICHNTSFYKNYNFRFTVLYEWRLF
jgi:hypothetical protein